MRYRRVQVQQLIGMLFINCRVKTIHAGNLAHHSELDSNVYNWVANKRDNAFDVPTGNIICNALNLEPEFKNRCNKKLLRWA